MLKYLSILILMYLLMTLVTSNPWILNNTVSPIKYDIKITPYIDGPESFTFDGEVKLSIKTSIPTKYIQLNGHESYFSSIEIKIAPENNPSDESLTFIRNELLSTEIIDMELNKELIEEITYVVSFNYTGIITNDMLGFYKSVYVEDDKEEIMMITQLQQTEARKLLPCFDEPEYKAKFMLTINYPKEFIVRANTLPLNPPESIE